MKRVKWLFFAGVFVSCVVTYAITMLPQDLIFSEYKKALGRAQHAPQTTLVHAYNSFGALDKNRIMYKDIFPQGCDYRVGQVRKYSGIKESIRAFYAGQTFLVGGEEKFMGVLFIPRDPTGLIDPLGVTREESLGWGPAAFSILEELRDDQRWGFLKLEPGASYYFVSSGGFSESDLDLRCQF